MFEKIFFGKIDHFRLQILNLDPEYIFFKGFIQTFEIFIAVITIFSKNENYVILRINRLKN